MPRVEPKVRKDGTCAECGGPRVIEARAGVDPKLYEDPFCSSVCAKAYFGTVTSLTQPGRPKQGGQQ